MTNPIKSGADQLNLSILFERHNIERSSRADPIQYYPTTGIVCSMLDNVHLVPEEAKRNVAESFKDGNGNLASEMSGDVTVTEHISRRRWESGIFQVHQRHSHSLLPGINLFAFTQADVSVIRTATPPLLRLRPAGAFLDFFFNMLNRLLSASLTNGTEIDWLKPSCSYPFMPRERNGREGMLGSLIHCGNNGKSLHTRLAR